MSRFPRFVVTLEVVVTDARKLLKAARDRAEESGCKRATIKDSQDALHWILDPGSSPEEGWEIENSDCERQQPLTHLDEFGRKVAKALAT